MYRRRETHRPSRRAPTLQVYPSFACRGRLVGSPYAAQAVPSYGPLPPIALRLIVISKGKFHTDQKVQKVIQLPGLLALYNETC